MKKSIYILLIFLLGGLFAQSGTVLDIDDQSFTSGTIDGGSDGQSQLSESVAKVFVNVIQRCSTKINKDSRNVYVLVNNIEEPSLYNLDLAIKRQLYKNNDYFDFTPEVDIRRRKTSDIITSIKQEDYFSRQLELKLIDLDEILTTKTSNIIPSTYIYILKDFKVALKKGSFVYNIRLSVVNPRISKVVCNVVKRIDVTDKTKKPPTVVVKEVEKKENKVKNFISVGSYISGNLLKTGFYDVFNYLYKDRYEGATVLTFGGSLEYSRHILDSFYLGSDIFLGYLYYSVEDDAIFQKGLRQLVLNVSVKPTYMLNLSKEYDIDLLFGGKIGYLNFVQVHNFFVGAFVGMRFNMFKFELAYPFPWFSMAVVFPI